jgi:hypothetical protein
MRMQINIAHVRDCAADYLAGLEVRALVAFGDLGKDDNELYADLGL